MSSIDTIINRQFGIWERQKLQASADEPPIEPLPIITVSRQKGSRGSYFASRLAEKLGYQQLHREVIDAICKSSGYRERVIESLDQHVRGDLDLAVESAITGQSVDHSDYVRHLIKVILSMARLGGVVVTGRGANFILGLSRGVHFRVIAPNESRVKFLMKYDQLCVADALTAIDQTDRERREFVRKLFDKEIDSPQYYDVVFNSALIDIEEMVDAALLTINTKMDKLRHTRTA